MAIIFKELNVIEFVSGDTLPTVDVIIGTKARDVVSDEWLMWDGTTWVPHVESLHIPITWDQLVAKTGRSAGDMYTVTTADYVFETVFGEIELATKDTFEYVVDGVSYIITIKNI